MPHLLARRRLPLALSLAFAAIALGGCSGQAPHRATSRRHGISSDTLSNGVPRAYRTPLDQWIAMWRRGNPMFAVDSLARTEWREQSTLSFNGTTEDLGAMAEDDSALYLILGVPSPDGRYRLIINANAEFEMEGHRYGVGEVEEDAELLDLKTQRSCRVAYCGTPCSFDWAGWLDSTHVALAGVENDSGQLNDSRGFVYVISLADSCQLWFQTRPMPYLNVERYRERWNEWFTASYVAWKASHGRS